METERQEYEALCAKLAAVTAGAPMFALTPAERERYHELRERLAPAPRARGIERAMFGGAR